MIEENLENSKAWFRRGEAYFCLNDWDNAKADFEKTVQLDQDNKAAKNKVRVSVFFRIWDGMGWDGMDFTYVYCQVLLCEQKIKTHRQKEKKTFANMFDKFAAIDQKRSVIHHIFHLWINQLDLRWNLKNLSRGLNPPKPGLN